MKTVNFVGSLLLLCDVLPHIVRLSKLLQAKRMDVTFLRGEVETCLSEIQLLRDAPTSGVHFSQFAAECAKIELEIEPGAQEDFLRRTGEISPGQST